MKSPKGAEFSERQKIAGEAKAKLLAKFKAAPKFDDPEMAAKLRAREETAKAREERRAAAAAEKAEAAQREAAERQAALEAEKAASAKVSALTEAERKAERDRKYAARKARK